MVVLRYQKKFNGPPSLCRFVPPKAAEDEYISRESEEIAFLLKISDRNENAIFCYRNLL